MSECIGMSRVEVEADIIAVVADVIAQYAGMSEDEKEAVKDYCELNALVGRGVIHRCPVHPRYYISQNNQSYCLPF